MRINKTQLIGLPIGAMFLIQEHDSRVRNIYVYKTEVDRFRYFIVRHNKLENSERGLSLNNVYENEPTLITDQATKDRGKKFYKELIRNHFGELRVVTII